MADSNSTLAKVLEKLNSQGTYTPLTEEQITEQANRRFQSQYDTQRMAAQQQADSTDLALAQQLIGLQETYDRQRKQSAENYAQAISQHDRNLVDKGMQRSSYGAATRANIALKGNEAQAEIGRNQAAQEGSIGAQRAQNQQQLAQKLAQYDVSQKTDALAYGDQLRDREYDRQQAANNNYNSLALNIAQLQHQQEAAAASQSQWEKEFAANQSQWEKQFAFNQSQWNDQKDQWEREFNAKYGNRGGGTWHYSGGGGGGGGNNRNSSNNPVVSAAATSMLAGVAAGINQSTYAAWMNSLNQRNK